MDPLQASIFDYEEGPPQGTFEELASNPKVLDDFRAIRKMKPAAISRGIKLLLSVFFIAHATARRKISKDEAFALFD